MNEKLAHVNALLADREVRASIVEIVADAILLAARRDRAHVVQSERAEAERALSALVTGARHCS